MGILVICLIAWTLSNLIFSFTVSIASKHTLGLALATKELVDSMSDYIKITKRTKPNE